MDYIQSMMEWGSSMYNCWAPYNPRSLGGCKPLEGGKWEDFKGLGPWGNFMIRWGCLGREYAGKSSRDPTPGRELLDRSFGIDFICLQFKNPKMLGLQPWAFISPFSAEHSQVRTCESGTPLYRFHTINSTVVAGCLWQGAQCICWHHLVTIFQIAPMRRLAIRSDKFCWFVLRFHAGNCGDAAAGRPTGSTVCRSMAWNSDGAGYCEDLWRSVKMLAVFAMVLQRVAAEESRGSVKALFLDYDGTLREFEASEPKTCKTQKLRYETLCKSLKCLRETSWWNERYD